MKKVKKKSLTAAEQIAAAGGGKKHKYNVGSKEDRTYNGITYHSVLERRVAVWLGLREVQPCSRCYGTGHKDADCRRRACPHCHGGVVGDILQWERQVKFDLFACEIDYPCINGEMKKDNPFSAGNLKKVGTYRIDFVVHFADGHTEHIEVKGHWTQLAKLKWAIFKANHPEFKTRVITKGDIPDGF